jgi:hypothetical protein
VLKGLKIRRLGEMASGGYGLGGPVEIFEENFALHCSYAVVMQPVRRVAEFKDAATLVHLGECFKGRTLRLLMVRGWTSL